MKIILALNVAIADDGHKVSVDDVAEQLQCELDGLEFEAQHPKADEPTVYVVNHVVVL